MSYTNIKLWEEKFFLDLSDVNIIFNGIKYRLNKQLLSVSDILRNTFTNGFAESFQDSIVIDVEEISIKSWELLLNYIYDKYVNFYGRTFNLSIARYNKLSFDISSIDEMSNDDFFALYSAKNYFDVASAEMDHTLYIKLENEIRHGNFESLSNFINIAPSVDYIVNNIIKSLDDMLLPKLMASCIATDDDTDTSLDICNNIFSAIVEKFKVPSEIDNIYELEEYLEPKKLALSESMPAKFYSQDPLMQDQILTYLVLKYPDTSISKLTNLYFPQLFESYTKYPIYTGRDLSFHGYTTRQPKKKLI